MSEPRRVMVVTGSRAEFGLLRPVMHAIARRRGLSLIVVASGSHLVPLQRARRSSSGAPQVTVAEVEAQFAIAARVPMQQPGVSHRTRVGDAQAVGRGVTQMATVIERHRPDWLVVLGDRIEAFAAASAASIAGVAVCHIHGGDRAEGIADEAMRHAITKLGHMHCAATPASARRITRMGEPADRVFVTGSPAIDGLRSIPAMTDARARTLGDPDSLVLVHPSGVSADADEAAAAGALALAWALGGVPLVLSPNLDAGRERIVRLFDRRDAGALLMHRAEHLPRGDFVGLLKRLRARGGVLIGNSSAGLIEAAAIGTLAVNIGPRQAGRERAANVIDVPTPTPTALARVAEALGTGPQSPAPSSLYGDGRAGERIAALLARHDPRKLGWLRKRNTY